MSELSSAGIYRRILNLLQHIVIKKKSGRRIRYLYTSDTEIYHSLTIFSSRNGIVSAYEC